MTWFQKPILGTPLDWSNPLNDGLVMHLGMQEGNGDKVQDLSLNGNHGTLNNFAFPPTVASGWNPGQTGIGLNFELAGSNYIDCGTNDSLSVTKAITIAATIKTSSVAAFLPIVLKGGTWANVVYHLTISSGRLRFRMNGSSFADVGSPLLNDGVPHNVAITYANPGTVWLYIDGIPYDGGSHAADIGVNALAVRVGGPRDGNHFEEVIDQPRIQSRAWSAKEVRDYAINPWQVYLDAEDM